MEIAPEIIPDVRRLSAEDVRPNTILTLNEEQGKRFLQHLATSDHKPTPALERAFEARRRNLARNRRVKADKERRAQETDNDMLYQGMEKVFVVTTGSYSEYSLKAIFSTQPKAQRYLELISDPTSGREADIEEFRLDEYEDWIKRNTWLVQIREDNGDILLSYTREENASAKERGYSRHAFYMTFSTPYFEGVSYESYEHALKLAVESRQAWLREQAVSSDPAKIG